MMSPEHVEATRQMMNRMYANFAHLLKEDGQPVTSDKLAEMMCKVFEIPEPHLALQSATEWIARNVSHTNCEC